MIDNDAARQNNVVDSSPDAFQNRFGFLSKPPSREELVTHNGIILYLEDVTLSFDGFKALNDLTL
jgi:hypothetical protein